MDLVQTLSSRLEVEPKAAEAVAGALLGTADDELPAAETATLEGGVPELDGWRASAEETLAGGADLEQADGLLHQLSELAGSGVGDGLLDAMMGRESDTAAAGLALLAHLGLEPSQAVALVATVTDFLTERLGDEWTRRILVTAPVLLALVSVVGKNGGFDLGEVIRGLIAHELTPGDSPFGEASPAEALPAEGMEG